MTSVFTIHEVQQLGRPLGVVVRPSSVLEAVLALNEHAGARPLAGGTDLLLDLQRSGPGPSVTIVDLTGIDGFGAIQDTGDSWHIAGGVTHNQVVLHKGIRSTSLPLVQACLEIGSPQLRNRATLAGNIATASPANDSISALMALNAQIELSSFANEAGKTLETRTVPIREFFTGFRETVLEAGELITAIVVPKLGEQERGLWVKLGLRKAQAISVVHAGLVIGFDTDGKTVTRADLAVGSVAPTVVMADLSGLVGSTLDPAASAVVAKSVAKTLTPITDGRATAHYRTDAVVTLLTRSLDVLADNKQASMWPPGPPTLSSAEQLASRRVPPAASVTAETPITVSVNGSSASAAAGTSTLLDWVRDEVGLTGMKEGCAEGECGACTMLLDGVAVMSCLVTAAQADGSEVSTVEGLDHSIQQAFVDDFAVQCGFCIPGFLMAGARLIDECPDPTDTQIELGFSGNLCRCTGYYPIAQAVRDAAVEVRGRRD